MPPTATTTDTSQIAIEARSLTKDYGGRSVLRRIDLAVRCGECLWLKGANGSGKTTLLRCLAALAAPTSGHVAWFGRDARSDPLLRRWVGMAAHESRLYPHLSLRENLLFSARLFRLDQPAARADQMLEEIGLAKYSERTPLEISRGMLQRVSLARAMIHQPRIVLLDEPSTGLDAQGERWMLQWLAAARQRGQTICLVTHDQRLASRLAHRVIELRSGRLWETSDAFAADMRRDALAGRAA